MTCGAGERGGGEARVAVLSGAKGHYLLYTATDICLFCCGLQPGSQGAADYTALVTEMSQELHAAIPGSQVGIVATTKVER